MIDETSARDMLEEILTTLKGTNDKKEKGELRVQYLDLMNGEIGEILSPGERKQYLDRLNKSYG